MEKTYYKITNEKECHNGYQYVDGLNILDKPFDSDGCCVEGGLYFTTIEHIFNFLDYGCHLREITLPENCQWVQDLTKNKYRADKIILGKKYNLSDPLTFQLLIERGANIHAPDVVVQWASLNNINVHMGYNCVLVWAFRNCHLEIVKWLMKNGIDICVGGVYALRLASDSGHLEVVKYLVENGVDIHSENNCALQLASENGHLEVVKYLVEKGANIHANDNYASRLASENGHLEVAKYLVCGQCEKRDKLSHE